MNINAIRDMPIGQFDRLVRAEESGHVGMMERGSAALLAAIERERAIGAASARSGAAAEGRGA